MIGRQAILVIGADNATGGAIARGYFDHRGAAA